MVSESSPNASQMNGNNENEHDTNRRRPHVTPQPDRAPDEPEHSLDDFDDDEQPPADVNLGDIVNAEHEAEPPEAGTMRAEETGSPNGQRHERWHIEEGTDVIGTCGHKIGEVMDVEDDFLVVEQGFFITHDIHVPKSVIAGLEQDGLHLKVSKQDADHAGWGEKKPA